METPKLATAMLGLTLHYSKYLGHHKSHMEQRVLNIEDDIQISHITSLTQQDVEMNIYLSYKGIGLFHTDSIKENWFRLPSLKCRILDHNFANGLTPSDGYYLYKAIKSAKAKQLFGYLGHEITTSNMVIEKLSKEMEVDPNVVWTKLKEANINLNDESGLIKLYGSDMPYLSCLDDDGEVTNPTELTRQLMIRLWDKDPDALFKL